MFAGGGGGGGGGRAEGGDVRLGGDFCGDKLSPGEGAGL